MRTALAIPSKPPIITSSPQRVEKLAMPPFKLLKGKGGSRSRRRSPLFSSRTRTGSSIQEGKEPSSPKVTCIGQVRMKKKKTTTMAENTHRSPSPYHCKPTSNPPSDIPLPINSSPRGLRRRCSILTWWFSSLCSARYEEKKARDEDASPKKEKTHVIFRGLAEKEAVVEEVKAPTDALLLMRCKSAPFKDSDLTFESKKMEEKDAGANKASLVRESARAEYVRDRESSDEDASREGDARLLRSLSSRPLMLARCRSEPSARKQARGGGDGCKSFDRCEKARTSFTLAAEVLPFGLLQSTFRFV